MGLRTRNVMIGVFCFIAGFILGSLYVVGVVSDVAIRLMEEGAIEINYNTVYDLLFKYRNRIG